MLKPRYKKISNLNLAINHSDLSKLLLSLTRLLGFTLMNLYYVKLSFINVAYCTKKENVLSAVLVI